MPGTFAHIALVDSLCNADTLDSIPQLTPQMKRALMQFVNFCELGAVSPDYPYLTPLDDSAAGWANVMHYWKTADFIRNAVRQFCVSGIAGGDPAQARHCIAWIFGFAAHVVADLAVHPIIQLKVGAYEQHKTEHRICEMNQDVYIFKQITGLEVGSAEYFRRGGVASCSSPSDKTKLDPAVTALWTAVLGGMDRSSIRMADGIDRPESPPSPDEWHHWFIAIVDKVAEEGAALPVLSRHLAEDKGVCYPAFSDVRREYIDDLRKPDNSPTNYDAVFRCAQERIKQVWGELGAALAANNPSMLTLTNGNLDTGIADADPAGSTPIFWRA